MEERIHYTRVSPGAYHAMLGLEKYLHECGLEEGLGHLIKLRADRTRYLPALKTGNEARGIAWCHGHTGHE